MSQLKRCLALVLLTIWSANAGADANDVFAHYSTGIAAQHICYGVVKSALHLREDEESWKANGTCMMANAVLFLLIQVVATGNHGSINPKDYGNDLAGIATGGLTIRLFSF